LRFSSATGSLTGAVKYAIAGSRTRSADVSGICAGDAITPTTKPAMQPAASTDEIVNADA